MSVFFPENRFDISFETICMECQIIFSEKNKKHILNLSSDEFAHSMLSINNSKVMISISVNHVHVSETKHFKC